MNKKMPTEHTEDTERKTRDEGRLPDFEMEIERKKTPGPCKEGPRAAGFPCFRGECVFRGLY